MAKRALSNLSVSDLERELRHRQRRSERIIARLSAKRDRLVAKVTEIESEIRRHGGGLGRRVAIRKRPKNKMNLADALAKVLANTQMSVTEVAAAVQKAGYMTTSPSFRTIVNQTLIKDKRFKRVERGQYTVR